MQRHVVLLGKRSYVISLPKQWVVEHRITKSSLVDVEIDGASLNIYPPNEVHEGRSTAINVTGTSPMTKRILGALYKAGYDELKITFSTSEEMQACQDIIREEFIGFEIVHHGKKSMTARMILAANSNEFDALLRRMMHVLESMTQDLIEANKHQDACLLQTIALRDKDVNKLADYCRRTVSLTRQQHGPLYHVVETLEKIGDCCKDLCTVQMSSRVLSYYILVAGVLKEFISLYHDFSLEKITAFGSTCKTLHMQGLNMINTVFGDDSRAVFFILLLLDHVFSMNGPVMVLRL